MGMNRLEEFFRDPTLDNPPAEYFRVRLPWESIFVDRATDRPRPIPERIRAETNGRDAPKLIRCETITGSVVYVRTDTVMMVFESTPAQRRAERRLWKLLDEEEDAEKDDNPDPFGD